MTAEYILGTLLAAFAASAAAVLLGAFLDSRARRREAKSRIIRALTRHIERLWEYSVAHGESRRAGVNNRVTFNGEFAPFKPPMAALRTEIRAERPYFGRFARNAVDEMITDASHSEVDSSDRAVLADWKVESEALSGIAMRTSEWNMRSSRLPPL